MVKKTLEAAIFWSHDERVGGAYKRALLKERKNKTVMDGYWIIWSMDSWTGFGLDDVLRTSADRVQWRKAVHSVANPWTEEG